MLYTRKGDEGKTKIFGCDQRISKSSAVAEALGSLDEINSFLGLCKSKAREFGYSLLNKKFDQIINEAQESLFTIQAEVAGADKHLTPGKIRELERLVVMSEKEMPPIKTFFISGASELSAMFDVARTIARRAERRAVAVSEEGLVKISSNTLAYLNRLSSLLYALARLSAYKSGIKESAPDYK